MSTGTARALFVFFLALNCILWSTSRYGHPNRPSLLHGQSSLVKRISDELSTPQAARLHTNYEEECQPLAFPVESQCHHVEENCPDSDTALSIQYLQHYFCAEATLRPLVFVGLLVWLAFLFSTLGISASDFFTPNLATIAQILGLDENVAGVTFLAFGNGSPDLFSTFSAMRADSGSLAVGELLGAATFIVSCVVGSMCIIKPFQVHRIPFLRDVGFFFAAVTLILVILWDGRISRWEAATLVALYLIYVVTVIVGSWWERKRERRRFQEAQERDAYAESPYTDEPLPTLTVTPKSPPLYRNRAISAPAPPRLETNLPPRPYSRSPSPSSTHITQLPSFSIIGALEFRDVVASLKKQAAGNSLSLFETPVTPYAGGHYHSHIASRSRHSSLASSMDEETLNALPLGHTGRGRISSSNATIHEEPRDLLSPDSSDYFAQDHSSQPPIPSIFRTPASPSASESSGQEQLFVPQTRRQRFTATLGHICHILFPTLHNFRNQTMISRIACVLAAPTVLCLTLTLPVVVTPYQGSSPAPEKLHNDARLIDFEEEGMERVLIAEEEIEENIHELTYNKWLMAAQCIFGPLFCVYVLFRGSHRFLWIMIGTLVGGLVAGALVLRYTDKGNSPIARMSRCSMGFAVSMVWIMAIADEVVSVLQTFGLIFGLSDAIIGLTIFAVGNSLADLVANMSVAVFAPIMGFSACFGGPMLNILLGIGVSGSYIIQQTAQPYALHLSKTLFVSAFGLLFVLAATMVFVPLNDYYLTKRWGTLLIATYLVIMIVNIIVESKS
ncbi:hypothetical protein D9613_007752 [Agrocybe pediades]|uniref:Sodium/calcium exchanger membrane region domain-containing protein n=1 Tax=Agrocybe pediades TaxID=84607 RepID=A0A8H4QN61_9AGAR|nr:hypothetical protein D9613_007752 [Agrocybe pediades]KAF9565217.1 hypothetical protein CPC08DRAFT_659476 [Agrocybe pediades]